MCCAYSSLIFHAYIYVSYILRCIFLLAVVVGAAVFVLERGKSVILLLLLMMMMLCFFLLPLSLHVCFCARTCMCVYLFMYLCMYVCMCVSICLCVCFIAGDFTVTEEFPHGAFLRPTVTGRGKEESPFTSMALSLYWVVVTVTSVGYGEYRTVMKRDEE